MWNKMDENNREQWINCAMDKQTDELLQMMWHHCKGKMKDIEHQFDLMYAICEQKFLKINQKNNQTPK